MRLLRILLSILILLTASTVFAEESTLGPDVDYIGGYIIVEGTGVLPENTSSQAQAVALARLAAKVDAQRNLLEIITGLKLNSETSMINLMANDVVKTRVEGMLQGAQIVPGSEYLTDGIYHLELYLDMVDFTSLIDDVKETAGADDGYTGLIIDATGLNITASGLFEIRDPNRSLVYSANRSYYQPQESIFKATQEDALSDPRAGKNPLIVKAVDTGSNDGSILIVSEGDGQLILNSLQSTDVFLLSKILVISGGSENGS